jgi:hypothetical protein
LTAWATPTLMMISPAMSALLLSDALHAICAASQPIRRCTTP